MANCMRRAKNSGVSPARLMYSRTSLTTLHGRSGVRTVARQQEDRDAQRLVAHRADDREHGVLRACRRFRRGPSRWITPEYDAEPRAAIRPSSGECAH
jgi:hypothetical protein